MGVLIFVSLHNPDGNGLRNPDGNGNQKRRLKEIVRVFPREARAVILTRIEGLKFSNCQNSHDVCNVRGSHSVAETQVSFILINLYISCCTQ